MKKRPYTKEELEQIKDEWLREVDKHCHEIAAIYGPKAVVEYLQSLSGLCDDWIAKNDPANKREGRGNAGR